MKVEVCKTAGFCGGVQNAINKLNECIEKKEDITLYKPILHNQSVLDKYAQKGVFVINDLSELKNNKILIRAHGETKQTFEEIEKKKIEFIDCTCVNVKRIHSLVKEYSAKGYKIIVIGKYKAKMHPEIQGIISYADSPILIEDEADIVKLEKCKETKFFAVSQTTLISEKVEELYNQISQKLQGKEFKFVNTTCAHQKNNVQNSIALCKQSDFAIVLGDKMSNNTKELFVECSNICKCYFAEGLQEIKDILKSLNLTNGQKTIQKIALLAGASTDKEDLQEAKKYIENYQ